MASSNVSQFLQKIGQGVKPNMFLIDINFPQSIALQTEDQQLTNILCKSAALPGSNLGVIEVPFRGRTVKIAGDRTFDTWTATFFNDKDFKLRSFFEQWANSINTHEGNTSPLFTPNNSDGYMADLGVKQLEKDSSEEGSILRAYSLKYCFPTNVSQIDLAYDSNDQIEEFTVEWQYSYFTAEAGTRDGVSGLQVV
tara:strand:+ start:2081 stop:2668 length:588 start_codon:yes stop_codon:yes gene_type:complete